MKKQIKQSAGLLMSVEPEVALKYFSYILVAPFWSKKDEGSWTFLKGEYAKNEEPRAAAQREFTEVAIHYLVRMTSLPGLPTTEPL